MTAAEIVSAPSGADTGDAPVLEVEGLSTAFTRDGALTPVLVDVSFALRAGATLTLLGESGSGKSVTVRSILRLYERGIAQIDGRVSVDGVDVTALDEAAMLALRGPVMSMIQQDPSTTLDPLRRIGAQMRESLRAHAIVGDNRAALAESRRLLTAVGIGDPDRVLRSRPHQISGGMRQRVAIAIAVGTRPRIILADEPTTALDVTVQAQVLDLLVSLKESQNLALLMITHDVGVAKDLGGDVAVMYAGRIVEYGPAEAVLTSPRHPYTRALLDALPTPGVPRGQLKVIPGQLPAAADRAADACSFAPRCARATAACVAARPAERPDLDGRLLACVNPVPDERALV